MMLLLSSYFRFAIEQHDHLTYCTSILEVRCGNGMIGRLVLVIDDIRLRIRRELTHLHSSTGNGEVTNNRHSTQPRILSKQNESSRPNPPNKVGMFEGSGKCRNTAHLGWRCCRKADFQHSEPRFRSGNPPTRSYSPAQWAQRSMYYRTGVS